MLNTKEDILINFEEPNSWSPLTSTVGKEIEYGSSTVWSLAFFKISSFEQHEGKCCCKWWHNDLSLEAQRLWFDTHSQKINLECL